MSVFTVCRFANPGLQLHQPLLQRIPPASNLHCRLYPLTCMLASLSPPCLFTSSPFLPLLLRMSLLFISRRRQGLRARTPPRRGQRRLLTHEREAGRQTERQQDGLVLLSGQEDGVCLRTPPVSFSVVLSSQKNTFTTWYVTDALKRRPDWTSGSGSNARGAEHWAQHGAPSYTPSIYTDVILTPIAATSRHF